MNLPNKLTVMRFVLVPVFMIFVLMPESVMSDTASRCIAAVLFGVTALTDLFDGKIARKYNLVTNFGKFMDPLADKFMIFGALLSIVAKYDDLRGVMVWVAITVMLRGLAVTSIRLIAAGTSSVVISASMLGKIKTTVQCIAIEITLLEPVIFGNIEFFAKYYPLTWFSMILLLFFTLYSGIDYIVKYKDFLKDAK